MEETHGKKPRSKNKRRVRVKLIFNPGSGSTDESPVILMDVIQAMQECEIVPEVYLTQPENDLDAVVQEALEGGIDLFVVCGGDGTINPVAKALAGTKGTLGIIPTGTRNNVALSLGIPADIEAAIDILHTGRRIQVDMGVAASIEGTRLFLEVCSVGLISTLFPAADDIQHGNLARVGDFLTALLAAPPAEMHLVLDDREEITATCQAVLVSNMPYFGPNYQVGALDGFGDGLLDVLLFADLTKLDLVGYAAQVISTGGEPEEERIQRYQCRKIEINTTPPMQIMTDGEAFGEGPLQISLKQKALTVMVSKENGEETGGAGKDKNINESTQTG